MFVSSSHAAKVSAASALLTPMLSTAVLPEAEFSVGRISSRAIFRLALDAEGSEAIAPFGPDCLHSLPSDDKAVMTVGRISRTQVACPFARSVPFLTTITVKRFVVKSPKVRLLEENRRYLASLPFDLNAEGSEAKAAFGPARARFLAC